MIIRIRIIVFAALFTVSNAHAACSDTLYGTASKYSIHISDGGCTHEEKMITFEEINISGNEKNTRKSIPFSSECKYRPGISIECKTNGKTPLAGAKYKSTNDTNPVCGGSGKGARYTCIKGCKNGAPPYLYWEPYEC